MYWLAMLTMLIDHVGLVFFPTDPAWRIAGRLAFPIYAYALYMGVYPYPRYAELYAPSTRAGSDFSGALYAGV